MAGATWNVQVLGAGSVCTIQPCTSLQCHFFQSHMDKVYACLAVTCHLDFWQNDRDLLRATAVTQGWSGYRNKSQHKKLTLEKKIIPPFMPELEPWTFRSRVRRSNHWAIHASPLTISGIFLVKLAGRWERERERERERETLMVYCCNNSP